MKKTPAQIYSWMDPRLEVKVIDKYGYANLPTTTNSKKSYEKKTGNGKGVFAKAEIKKNEVLFVMGGYILDIEDENNLSGIIADKPIEISDKFSIGPRAPSDLPLMPQHYVNHGCSPNAGFKGQIFMVAIKKIKPGEEILYDYAMVMHASKESDSYFEFECLCDSKECRTKIGENDWKLKTLQNRYDGFFQFFIQEKIRNKKKT